MASHQPDDEAEWQTGHRRAYYLAVAVVVHVAVLLWLTGWLGTLWSGVVGLVVALPLLVLAALIWRRGQVPFAPGMPAVQARRFAVMLAVAAVAAATFDTQGWRIGRWIAAGLEGAGW